jgi:hypothetical protein
VPSMCFIVVKFTGSISVHFGVTDVRYNNDTRLTEGRKKLMVTVMRPYEKTEVREM